MIATLNRVAPRLKKLLLMLSSSQPGEVINAARAIDNTLRGAGADWHDLTAGLLTPTAAQSRRDHGRDRDDDGPDWRAMRKLCLRHASLLRPREREFMVSLGDWRGALTEKQSNWLNSIYARLRRSGAR